MLHVVVEESAGLLPAGVYADLAEEIARLIEITGVLILAIGGLFTGYQALRNAMARRPVYVESRRTFGKVLGLALEVLVAADIVQTVAVDLTLESVATLGLLVLVRTVLSFSLSAELEGIVPWRRAEFDARMRASGQVVDDSATPRPSRARPGGG